MNYLANVDYRKKRFALERLDIIRRHLKKPATGARLLDVGCGTGWFLEVAKDQGYIVTGLEIGKDLARYTSEKLEAKVHTVPLTELPATEVFDVITLFDVLEHVREPRLVLKSLREHLNPGGIGLIFSPNLDSVGITILQDHSSLVMPAEHLFYFTPRSLRQMIEQTPLDVIDFQTKGMDIPICTRIFGMSHIASQWLTFSLNEGNPSSSHRFCRVRKPHEIYRTPLNLIQRSRLM